MYRIEEPKLARMAPQKPYFEILQQLGKTLASNSRREVQSGKFAGNLAGPFCARKTRVQHFQDILGLFLVRDYGTTMFSSQLRNAVELRLDT